MARFKLFQKRGSTLETPPKWFVDWLGVSKSASGINVNEKSAIGFTAVWSAVKILSEAVAGLPIQTFKQNGDSKELDRQNPIYSLLHSEPNPWMTSFVFHQAMMTNVLLYGNAFAVIHKDASETPKWLEIIPPDDVTISIKRQKWYKIKGRDAKVPDRNMIHIPGLSYNGLLGKSPIMVCQESIGLGVAAEKFGATFFGNGANMTGVLEAPFAMTPDQQKNLANSWDKKNKGLDKSGGTAILEGGLKYTRIGIPPEQAQFILTRKFQVTEIARIFNLPPHLIGDLERSTNNNIEQQSIEFVQFSLMPWLRRFEQEYNRKLFKEIEKSTSFVQFNVQGLLRGDAKARAEYYSKLWNLGTLSDNEIRAFENLNPIEGGDKHFVPLNMTPIENINNGKGNESNTD